MGQLVVEKSLEVEASARVIWDRMMEVSEWPSWKPFIKKAGVAGGYKTISNGSKITFSALVGGPVAIPLSAKVTEFSAPSRLAWEGGIPGVFHAVHSFDFKEVGGKTVVTSREVFSGFLLGAVSLMVSEDDLLKLHEQWVQAIKKKVEDKPGAEPEPEPAHH
jgi:hypothetical protein